MSNLASLLRIILKARDCCALIANIRDQHKRVVGIGSTAAPLYSAYVRLSKKINKKFGDWKKKRNDQTIKEVNKHAAL